MNEHKRLAIEALIRMKGDDLERAQRAFRNLSPAQMYEQYGQSGRTRRQILEGYVAHNTTINAAIAWVTKQN